MIPLKCHVGSHKVLKCELMDEYDEEEVIEAKFWRRKQPITPKAFKGGQHNFNIMKEINETKL